MYYQTNTAPPQTLHPRAGGRAGSKLYPACLLLLHAYFYYMLTSTCLLLLHSYCYCMLTFTTCLRSLHAYFYMRTPIACLLLLHAYFYMLTSHACLLLLHAYYYCMRTATTCVLHAHCMLTACSLHAHRILTACLLHAQRTICWRACRLSERDALQENWAAITPGFVADGSECVMDTYTPPALTCGCWVGGEWWVGAWVG